MRIGWGRAVARLTVLVAGFAVLAACASAPLTQRLHGTGHEIVADHVPVPTASGGVSLVAHYDPTRHHAPWILYVHGGYWSSGNGGGNEVWSERLRLQGFQVFSVDYRLSQVAKWPGPLDDVKAAIGFLRSHAATYGLDPTRGDLVGFSAGGQLATIAGLETGVAGVVDLDGSVDPLAALSAPNKELGRAARQLLGCAPSACPAGWQDARTITHVDATSPPFLIVHSREDPTVPLGQSVALARALRAAGRPVQLFVVSSRRHENISLPAVNSRVNRFLAATTHPSG
ncbi:MAG TPA: alpha/beta hydrolase [Jatrophihabitans sp.]|jgi:acetyl esterase/lipase|uniref:alpha/beta hydrolase n=1 Tax=Jatrophihabitans sp. TaxID=1932789 RepID=UPI002E06066A|nr:alpha/beta hydrolase [Jatrophihabitans sp.]